ncbi:MAG: DUF3343 domain-containing protein [Candidatus Faecousia sp.]|nr:DUF3343 domain-containing protein [Bacillota bacterium]MDY4753757.1 DUF3343 domain-containing protein [Candidatus Faecousia sp.]MDY6161195.1 DUF3343 domain-containing protein [Candidatus Faecousia sp.]
MNGRNVYLITFRSVTYAQRGERLLNRAGERCSLKRTPRWMEEQGCGYSLRLQTDNIERAVTLLRGEQLPMRKVYLRREDGSLEEITL